MPPSICALSGALTIQSASEQHAGLRSAAASGCAQLDLSAVTECDTAGVQLLLAAHRGGVQIQSASAAVRDALHRYGLDELLTAEAAR